METTKRGQAAVLTALLAVLIGSIVIVTGTFTNSTNNTEIELNLLDYNLLFQDNLTASNFNLSSDVNFNETINESFSSNNTQSEDNETIIITENQITDINDSSAIIPEDSSEADITEPELILNEIVDSNTSVQENNSTNESILTDEIETIIQTNNETHFLAKLQNEDSMDFDKDYKKNYLESHSNFSDLNFEKVSKKAQKILTVGARNENIKGFEVNNRKFAIDLISCNSYERYCVFRINGVPTKKMSGAEDVKEGKKNSFELDDKYSMKIESITYDFCDKRRFCHLGYEGYSIVNISIGVEQ